MSQGVDVGQLSDEDVLKELKSLHGTRHETFLHGSGDALDHHTQRQDELEQEYLRRKPGREVDPERTREGARERT